MRRRLSVRSLLATAAAATALIAGVQSIAHAHFIWAVVENGQVRFALLEDPNEKPSAQFGSYVSAPALSPRWGSKPLALLGPPKEGAAYATLPPAVSSSAAAPEGIVTAQNVVGVREREGETYLLVYHAKGAASLAAAETVTKEPAEVVVRRAGNELVVTVLRAGVPVPQAQVWVQWPGSGEVTNAAAASAASAGSPGTASSSDSSSDGSLRTDAKGKARLPWRSAAIAASPAAGNNGRSVGIRAMVTEAKSGEEGGKRYASIRRWATLTFPVSPTATVTTSAINTTTAGAGAAAAEKPFRRVLRESFGSSHKIVSGSAFNQTLFSGKLTREQLLIHLQQRALVHSKTDRILKDANSSHLVPYGPAQKNVLFLLRHDLTALGSDWPTEAAQARPLTRAFLQQIRESEKRGPFFALGVQHVYYGGITNGGRGIGKKIGETLGITLSYYMKSDGYSEYLTEVDKITDPSARQEMIRGAQAAYRYIIASSNEDVFQAGTAAAALSKRE